MHMQARAREDVVTRIQEVWNLHDTIYERINRCEQWVKDSSLEYTELKRTCKVVYMSEQQWHQVEIVEVHRNDDEPYYTIKLADGRERETTKGKICMSTEHIETRGLVALMRRQVARLRRLADEWVKRFGHWERGERVHLDEAALDALEREQAHEDESAQEEGEAPEEAEQIHGGEEES